MPFKSFWYEENKVVFTEVIGDFSLEEMKQANQEYEDIYFKHATDHIHLIVDLRGMTNFPKNLATIRDISKQTATQPQLGWFIFIGTQNTLLKFLTTTVFQLLRANCKIVGSLEEAEQLLERIRLLDSSSSAGENYQVGID